jgi:hypothetical protein
MGGKEYKGKDLKLSMYDSFNVSADGRWSVGESFVCVRAKLVFYVYTTVQRVFE